LKELFVGICETFFVDARETVQGEGEKVKYGSIFHLRLIAINKTRCFGAQREYMKEKRNTVVRGY
jgi:hypothetical protein